MGSIPAKYFLPSAPYGSSDTANALNSVQPGATNPQMPLLPPNFTDPGKMLAARQPLPLGNGQPIVKNRYSPL